MSLNTEDKILSYENKREIFINAELEGFLKKWWVILYTVIIVLCVVEGVFTLGYTLIRTFIYGLHDPNNLAQDLYGETQILNIYLGLTEIAVFTFAVLARFKLSFDHQYRFTTFLGVFLQLLVVLVVFLTLGFSSYIDPDDNVLDNEEFYILQGSIHIVIFGFVFYVARRFHNCLQRNENTFDRFDDA